MKTLLTPRPIHDKAEFQNVLEITDAMAGHRLTSDQEDYFDLLCRLIEDYEKERVDAPKIIGLEALQHLLDAHSMTAADLARLLGVHRTLGAMILRGERKLTLDHVGLWRGTLACLPSCSCREGVGYFVLTSRLRRLRGKKQFHSA